ncbi:glycine--tRNA ligase subunit beta [Usitatibacter palustris]|uniref:Glycine--tRNA ligase beta subunit n=1 Tax=Usitatibacter palustris TaxID=2732487 RepID=A0A6M4H565_9PROT|nr:glycine--tRNA ligase subunit beta [Usitatibacter palustris]QJR13674.1 Glycine--tRNA ligase beta subunit [Usitatibacter palustris]
MSAPLLVELICEELPPKALARLGAAFANGLRDGLAKRGLIDPKEEALAFSTPRRLAAGFRQVRAASEPKAIEVKLMPVSIGLDAAGKPTPALLKKLEAAGLAGADPATFKRRVDGKAEALFADATTPAIPLVEALQAALDETLAALPIPKLMSYQLADGTTTVHFVRPARALVALHGENIVPISALGLKAGRETHGHRFLGAARIALKRADDYERALGEEGGVIASFARRRAAIAQQLDAAAKTHAGSLGAAGSYDALLDEVTALVEMPTVYAGTFADAFLEVPQECLILTMRQNQKYFPLFDAAGKLTHRFLIVSNMKLADPTNIVQGNERVVRPRLADARFFFETDKKTKLADRVAQLGAIVYHNKLGTQAERVERLRRLASRIQVMLPRGSVGMPYADRAALLAKADLVTLMVGEFPELQGIMGKYYAEADGEEPSVVRAIEQHYWPRFAGDELPTGDVSIALALADKLESLIGLFGIGQVPTGDKDPFGLRRAALGVLRILSEKAEARELDLGVLLREGVEGFPAGKLGAETAASVHAFMLDRLRSMLRDKGYDANEVEAVLADNPTQVKQVWDRIEAVKAFRALPEASALAAANKRIQNILRKSEGYGAVDFALLQLPEEKRLRETLTSVTTHANDLFAKNDFRGTLTALAAIRADVDAFFDKVLVNAEDPKLRAARLGLLSDLGGVMNKVADISKLSS